jgi:hypothetical protein
MERQQVGRDAARPYLNLMPRLAGAGQNCRSSPTAAAIWRVPLSFPSLPPSTSQLPAAEFQCLPTALFSTEANEDNEESILLRFLCFL